MAATAGVAGLTIATLSVALLLAGAEGLSPLALGGGLLTVAIAFLAFQRWSIVPRSLEDRLDGGEPFTLRETIEVLELLDAAGPITPLKARQVLKRMQPAIGELVPLRESPIQGGINYRRLTFWRSETHGISLVGILWTPGTTAHIHSHDYSAVGRRIEGSVEMVDFVRSEADSWCVVRRTELGPPGMLEFAAGDTIHLVRNLEMHDAIDLHI